jgi:hypothetical protein
VHYSSECELQLAPVDDMTQCLAAVFLTFGSLPA